LEDTDVAVFLFTPKQEKEWRPAADIYRAPWGWILKFDLAGIRLEDIRVRADRNAVTVSGVRRDYMIEDGCCHYLMEITYSHFERTIELPDDLNKAQFRLDYRDGVLFVRIRREETEEETSK